MTVFDSLLALLFLGLAGLLIVYYRRARQLSRELDRHSQELRGLLGDVQRISSELGFVLDFIRVLPQLAGELNNRMRPRAIPQVLLRVVEQTFEPEQAVVLIRRSKTLAQPDGDRQFLVAAVAAPHASFGQGMVISLGEGDLGYVAECQQVMDRAALDREVGSPPSTHPRGLATFRPDLAAPMVIDEKTVGIIALRRPRRPGPHASEVIRVIAQMGASALDNLAVYAEVKSVADIDPLTRIWNKGVLGFRLGEAVFEAEEQKRSVSVFLFDIDYFKNYNDANGHVAGDRLLQMLARLVKEQTRREDVFGRFGGEEFLLILPDRTSAQARIIGEKIRASIEAYNFPFAANQPFGRLTISGGVASFPSDGRSSSELLRAADEALYRAKRGGRNQVIAAGRRFAIRA